MATKTEIERLSKLEEKTDNIEKKVDALDAKFDTLIERLDKKYAAKWVQNAVSFVIGLAAAVLIGAMIGQVIINPSVKPNIVTEK